jgi:hypothetical protein
MCRRKSYVNKKEKVGASERAGKMRAQRGWKLCKAMTHEQPFAWRLPSLKNRREWCFRFRSFIESLITVINPYSI